jgi:hypothetical protein
MTARTKATIDKSRLYVASIIRLMWYTICMSKALELAMQKAAALPEEAQEEIGREVLLRVETLAELRREIEVGIHQLDAGTGKRLNIADVIARARQQYGKGA